MNETVLAIVVPCYNESEVICETAKRLFGILDSLKSAKRISTDSFIMFVDDGSQDSTWNSIANIRLEFGERNIKGIKLSKNRGHQIAIYAGMEMSLKYSDVIITIDADLQQDPNAIIEFYNKYEEGYDIVYGVRNDRKTDSFFKRATGTIYYKLLRFLGCEIVEQSADYRLMSKRAVEALTQYKETNLFVRGIVPMIGFNSTTVYFDVSERRAGKSKYSVKRMIQLALDGITSFSIKPLRLFLLIGVIISLCSVGIMIFNLVTYLQGINLSGWTSISMTMLFLGGVELIGIGVLGEYIGRIYIETKKRPRYFIDSALVSENGKEDKV